MDPRKGPGADDPTAAAAAAATAACAACSPRALAPYPEASGSVSESLVRRSESEPDAGLKEEGTRGSFHAKEDGGSGEGPQSIADSKHGASSSSSGRMGRKPKSTALK